MPNMPNIDGRTAAAAPRSLSAPRLADIRFADRASLVSPAVLAVAVKALEALLLLASGLIIAHTYVKAQDIESSSIYVLVMTSTALTTVTIFHFLGLYKTQALTSPLRQLPRLVLGWTIAVGMLALAIFFLKVGPDLSRFWLAAWYAIAGALLVIDRLALALVTRIWVKQGRLTRRAVIYGGGEAACQLIARLEADAESDICICGVFDDRDGARVDRLVSG